MSDVVENGSAGELLVVIAGRSPRVHLARFARHADSGFTVCEIGGKVRPVKRPHVDLPTGTLTCSRCQAELDTLSDQLALD